MVQSPSWEANRFAASQEIPRISRNPKVHYRTHKRPPTVSILGQPNPVHIPTSHLLEIQPNIIHLSTPRSSQWSPSLRFPHQDPIHPPLLTHTRHMPSPSHYLLTYSMEQSPSWKANWFAASQKFLVFYGTRSFITTFTSTCHLSLSWASSIHSIPLYLTSWRSILILSFYASVFQVASFPQVLTPKPCTRLSPPHTRYMPRSSDSSPFYHPNNIWWAVEIIMFPIVYFFSTPPLPRPS